MKIIHVLLEQASHYDQTCFEADSAPEGTEPYEAIRLEVSELSAGRLRDDGFSLLHIHGSGTPPRKLLTGLPVPWISDRHLTTPRSLIRRPAPSARVVLTSEVPDCAPAEYFIDREPGEQKTPRKVGTWVRNGRVRNNVEQAVARMLRFRDDFDWTMFVKPPTPTEFASLDLWVDPAPDENDLDGLVCESIACSVPVVAARITANHRRLDAGRAGILTPPNDHNELVHAVLRALFRDETLESIRDRAKEVRQYLRPKNRRERLAQLYAEIAG